MGNRAYKEAHREEGRAQWQAWRERHKPYLNLYKRIRRRQQQGQDVAPADLELLAQLREAMQRRKYARRGEGDRRKKESRTIDAQKRVQAWEERGIPKPTYVGERWIRARMDDGDLRHIEWVAVRCRACRRIRWTHEGNGDVCFECLIHRCAADLRKWIDDRLEMGAARLGRAKSRRAGNE